MPTTSNVAMATSIGRCGRRHGNSWRKTRADQDKQNASLGVQLRLRVDDDNKCGNSKEYVMQFNVDELVGT
jgi:hypothetical protein